MSKWDRKLNEVITSAASEQGALNRILDGLIERTGFEPTCLSCTQPGCCYQPVLAFFPECLVIAKKLCASGLLPYTRRAELKAIGQAIESRGRGEHFRLKQPCVWLKNKRCSIYAYRPGACRRHLVSSPMADCSPDVVKNVVVLNTIKLDERHIAYQLALQRELVNRTEPVLWGALPKVVALAAYALETKSQSELVEFVDGQRWLSFDDPMAAVNPDSAAALEKARSRAPW